MLYESLASLEAAASRPLNLRMHCAVDADDLDTQTAMNDPELGICSYAVFPPQGYDQLHVYYQELADQALEADWLLVWNDDAVMVTPGWDKAIAELPPQVMVADLQSRHSPMCCFPAVRWQAVYAIGRFCSDNPHVDSFWEVVGQLSGTIAPVQAWVEHYQRAHAHIGNDHGFNHPDHMAELRGYARLLRASVEAAP